MDINKKPIKSLCPLLSESWDLEDKKGPVSREGLGGAGRATWGPGWYWLV